MKFRGFLSLFLVLALIFPLCGCAQTVPEGKVAVYLMVERLEEYANSDRSLRDCYEFDDQGNMVMHSEYQNGKEISYIRKEYDDHGNFVTVISYDDGEEKGRAARVYEYDESGRVTLYIGYDYEGNEEIRRTTQYDELGNISREATAFYGKSESLIYTYQYGADGKLLCKTHEEPRSNDYWKTEYTYSGDLLINESLYDIEGAQIEDIIYNYDSSGNLLEYRRYSDGELAVHKTYEYDQKGNKIHHEYKTSKGWHYIYDYKYNSDNQLIEQTYYVNRKLNYTTQYTYNKDGILIKEVKDWAESENVVTITYQYVRMILDVEQAQRLRETYSEYYSTLMLQMVE